MAKLQRIESGAVTELQEMNVNLESQGREDVDLAALRRAGKEPVMQRKFGLMSILGFSCLILGTWEGAYITLGIGFENGGPAGLIYSFLLVWAGTFATFVSLAELASMAPTSGGQYHWVSMLAPKSCHKLFSYITGWLTVAGWQGAIASGAYIAGTIIQGFIQLVTPTYVPHLWHGTLLFYAVLVFCIFVNTVIGTSLARIESGLLIIYILGFFGVLVPLVRMAPHGDARSVFATFANSGGWSSQGLSFMIGVTGNAFSFLGADGAYHMSEEIKNAPIVVPRSIVYGVVLNGIVGFGSNIAVLFCLGDPDNLLDTQYFYPFIKIILQATDSIGGSAVMVAIIILVDLGLCIGIMAASSRMLWSFARDRGVPGWRHLSKVDSKTSLPTLAICTTTILSVLLGLISVGSSVAFNDVISLTLASLYASYLVACALLLWRRCTGSIKSSNEISAFAQDEAKANLPGSAGNLVWGPWRVSGFLGTAVNAFACVYLIVVWFFAFWPPATPVTAVSMNYSSLISGAVAIFSALYYIFWARKTYTGPVVDVVDA